MKIRFETSHKVKLTGTVALGLLLAGSVTSSVHATFGSGFREFKQDSCDPLLYGVLTGDGYVEADLDNLYGQAYSMNAQRGCGFTKLPPVSTVDPNPGPAPFPQPGPLPDPFPQGGGDLSVGQFEPVPPVNSGPPVQNPFENPVAPPLGDPFANAPSVPPIGTGTAGTIGGTATALDLPSLEDEFEAEPSRNGLYARASGSYVWPSNSDGAFAVSTAADATQNPFTDEVGQSYGGSLSLGYGFNFGGIPFLSNIRSELQGSYYQLNMDPYPLTPDGMTMQEISEGQEVLFGGFLNVLADIDFGSSFVPYIGGGVGYGRRDLMLTDDTSNTHQFEADGLLYQGMIGVGYNITKSMTLDLGYKYLKSFDIENIEDQNTSNTNVWSLEGRDHHMVEGGLKYRF